MNIGFEALVYFAAMVIVAAKILTIVKAGRKRLSKQKIPKIDGSHSNRETYRLLAENLPDAIFSIGSDKKYKYVNKQVEKYSNVKVKAILGKRYDNVDLPEDVVESNKFHINEIMKNKKARSFNLDLQLGRRRICFETKLVPILDEAGNVESILGIRRDITRQRYQEYCINQAWKVAKISFWEIDSKAIISGPGGRKIIESPSELDNERLFKESVFEDIHPEDKKKVLDAIENSIKQKKQNYGLEFRIILEDGTIGYVMMHSRNDFNSDGKLIHRYGIVQDITELRVANRKLGEALESAEELAEDAMKADKAKSQFLANMSHEIRTPMNSIIGFSDILLGENLDKAEMDKISLINESGKSLLAIINDILDYSKIEAEQMDVEKIKFPVQEVLHYVESLMAPAAAKKKLEFGVIQCGSLPIEINSDGLRIRQCLINLVSNAIKFTSQGHVYLNVSLEYRDGNKEPFIRFDVEDTGIGIAKEKQDLVFESFCQADGSTSRKFGGTGLGLTITKRLAKKLGGELAVSSELGRGSVFSLILPTGVDIDKVGLFDKYELPTRDQVKRKVGELCQEDREALKSKKVLVAEDNKANQKLMSVLLNKLGIEAVIVDNGIDVVENACDGSFDLVFMDMQMPGQNGYEATKQIREKGLGVRVVALTANAMETDRQKCLNAGCDDYLAKPIVIDKFNAVILNYLVEKKASNLN